MLFTQGIFFLFAAITLLAYWAARSNTLRKLVILVASYVFYGFWDYRFVALLAGITVVDFFVALALEKASPRSARLLVTLCLTYNLGLLGFFKYCNFFAASLVRLASALGVELHWSTLQVVLPVGISFMTFQSLSYTLDVKFKKITPTRSFLDYATFIAFFPQLVAGPIVRASDFLSQLPEPRTKNHVDWRWSFGLFLLGFFKKACVADNLAPVADAFFSAPESFGVTDAWIGVLSYSAQIYCDFSGYSDMAIAVAGLFGFTLRTNFATPYLATDITDFWRRWHTSLSTWLRDYLYIPLGGGREGLPKTYRNLMITMLLGGLWHGASWNFVLWGAMHGLALVVHKEWMRRTTWRMPLGLGWLVTLLWVVLAWIPFRAPTTSATFAVLFALVGRGEPHQSLSMDGGVAWLGLLVLLFLAHLAWNRLDREVFQRLPSWQWGLSHGFAWAFVISIQHVGYVPFVYFQF